jgi:large subunit ribosomal protein L29
MTPTEIREMTDAELLEAFGEAKTEHFNLRFQLATNQLDNNSRIREVKRDIARILTVMREREADTSLTAAEERA